MSHHTDAPWARADKREATDLSMYGKQPGRCSSCGREDLWPYSTVGKLFRLRCKWCGLLIGCSALYIGDKMGGVGAKEALE